MDFSVIQGSFVSLSSSDSHLPRSPIDLSPRATLLGQEDLTPSSSADGSRR
jgi:hypothetical protein